MRKTVVEIHPAAPPKPFAGQPCNGCGVCCALETCPLGRLRFRQRHGPCPALTWAADEQRYHCGLLSDPRRHFGWLPTAATGLAARLCARWIAAGSGCDCDAEVQD